MTHQVNLVIPPKPGPWVDEAVCAQVDPELFFPAEGKGSDSKPRNRLAKQICAACPVRNDCAEYALTNRIDHGIWGGLTPHERQRLTGQLRTVEAQCGTRSGYVKHRREQQAPCDGCNDANSAYQRKYARDERNQPA